MQSSLSKAQADSKRNSQKEGLKRTKTYNPKRVDIPKLPPRPIDDSQKEGYSNSFACDKKVSQEKLINLKEALNATQNELYEALASEFKLKENMIGLEKHAMKLELENKILQKNRRQSVSTLTVIQQIMNELNKLKQENTQLVLQSKQVREGAIDALVEKEKNILELSEQIHNTENFYKGQLEQAREEIKLMQESIKCNDIKGTLLLEKQKTKELELNLESERKELLKRISVLENLLEEKEKEYKHNLEQLEKSLKEENEKKLDEHLKIVERDHKLFENSINILEKAEEKSDHYEVLCFNLQEKIKSLEGERNEYNNQAEELIKKNSRLFEEKIEKIQQNHAKQIEDLKNESLKTLANKNEYISQQERSKDKLLERISELEAENKKKLTEINKLLDHIHNLTQENSLFKKKLEDNTTKQEEYIKDLRNKFDTEKQLLTFELKHIKRLTLDDSAILKSPKKVLRKSSADFSNKKAGDKRNSLATKSIYMHRLLGHSPSLGLELLNNKDQFQFLSSKIGSDQQINANQQAINDSQKIMNKSQGEEINSFEDAFHANRAFSLDYDEKKLLLSQKTFEENNENERVKKVDELSSESDISGFSPKTFLDKEVQVNADKESFLEKSLESNKNDLFLPDYDLCSDKNKNNAEKIDKIEVNRAKFQNPSNKTSLKNDSKFFLMEDDSDDSANNLKSRLEKSHLGSSKIIKSKSDKLEESSPSKKFYFSEIEKKIQGISNLINDFLRVSKENSQKGVVFDDSKKNKFLKIQISLSDILKKIQREHFIITHELIKKTMIKLDSDTLKTLNYHKLLKFLLEGYTKTNDGHIEYNLMLDDILMKKSWRFQARYSKLRNFHKECQAFIASIKLDEKFKGSLPPFPPKKWFGNTEDEFLKIRQRELESYFHTLLTSPLCVQIIDKGVLRYFLYKEIWKYESEELKQKCEFVEKWEDMCKKAKITNEKNLQNNEINYEALGLLMKEEIKKIISKLDIAKNDLEILENNEAISILKYEEKRKMLEKEFSIRESFDENELKGVLA